MDAYFITVRLVHVVAATFWVGAALFNVGFLGPAVRASGPEGGRFMSRLVEDGHFSQAMGMASLLTIASGFLLYWRVSGGLDRNWVTTNTGIAFSIGGLAGFTAFVLGFAVIARAAARLSVLGAELATAGGPPLPEQANQLGMLQERLHRAELIETPLIVAAVVLMAVARYL